MASQVRNRTRELEAEQGGFESATIYLWLLFFFFIVLFYYIAIS